MGKGKGERSAELSLEVNLRIFPPINVDENYLLVFLFLVNHLNSNDVEEKEQ